MEMKTDCRCPFLLLYYCVLSFVCAVLWSAVHVLGNGVNITVVPEVISSIKENENQTVIVHFQRDDDLDKCEIQCSNKLNLSLQTSTPDLIDITNPKKFSSHAAASDYDYSLTTTNDTVQNSSSQLIQLDLEHFDEITFTINGKFLGRAVVQLDVVCLDDEGIEHNFTLNYPVPVIRADSKLGYIFVGVLSVLLCLANFLMSAEINPRTVWKVIKRPVAPAIGLFCQFFAMPLISFGVAQVAFVPYGLTAMGLGLFTAGCSPGGGASNAYTYLLDGNIDLSVTMTFLSTVFAYGFMPLWIYLLGPYIVETDALRSIQIPHRNIGISLLLLLVPVNLGILLWHLKPSWGQKAKKVLRPFFVIIIVFICTFGVYSNLYMFKLMSLRSMIAGLCVPWLGFMTGFVLAWLLKQPRENIVAISLETGIQNTGIAIVLLQLSFPKPDSEIASVMPVIVALFTPVPVLIALILYYGKSIFWKVLEGIPCVNNCPGNSSEKGRKLNIDSSLDGTVSVPDEVNSVDGMSVNGKTADSQSMIFIKR
ncbi:Ileal sodium/bile acid cotransporter [Trichinella spiralis]|uniref:Ileal sodium/bile acid cotransporter n=1 Tax=Trichinella spiralis TaxID=6334 RepID=A0A0V1BLV8_TRISP|nr:Ileal sodium/bile acid cotransporter [Trichinella spiralis]